MTDYFKDICDWQDDDEKPPEVYERFKGSLQLADGRTLNYECMKRDWNCLGKTKAENKAHGPIYEVVCDKYGLVTVSKNKDTAIKKLEVYLLLQEKTKELAQIGALKLARELVIVYDQYKQLMKDEQDS